VKIALPSERRSSSSGLGGADSISGSAPKPHFSGVASARSMDDLKSSPGRALRKKLILYTVDGSFRSIRAISLVDYLA